MAGAMFSKLPEEIIYEILKPVFHTIIIDTFIQRPALALYGCKYGSSPELPYHLPLVCKQWHRIITPLLYATVELRTEAGMRLLANTLAATPALGLLIRHLRLNAGYGLQLYTIVKSAPNIRIVSLNIHVLSKHTIAGLLR
ncbi:hypothetical protein BC629DRAFT_1571846 [Irpex lacteus]|nr:hypothetical protein BC629DRAFT_1571846 [Irpex lacteus]